MHIRWNVQSIFFTRQYVEIFRSTFKWAGHNSAAFGQINLFSSFDRAVRVLKNGGAIMSSRRFTRRGFLKGLGAAGAALGTGELSPAPAQAQGGQQIVRELRVDQYPEEHSESEPSPDSGRTMRESLCAGL